MIARDETKRIVYTPAAKERLDKLREKVDREIDNALREQGYIPGEQVLEVTASDVEDVARSMRIIFSTDQERRREQQLLLLSAYTIFGFITLLIGVFYRDIQALYTSDPLRALIVTSGGAIAAFSGMMLTYLRYRERRRAEFYRRYVETRHSLDSSI